MDTSIVLLSGGWESVACLLMSKKTKQKTVAMFVNYGQPYLAQEQEAVTAITNQLNVELFVEQTNKLQASSGVFEKRNEKFIELAIAYKPKTIYFGCRAPFEFFDRYKDSNWQFAKRMEKKHLVKIKTPLLLFPKFIVKSFVKKNNISPEFIFSSEGYKYDAI